MTRCEKCGLTVHMHFVTFSKAKHAGGGFRARCPIENFGRWDSKVWVGTLDWNRATERSYTFTDAELRETYETVRGPLAA